MTQAQQQAAATIRQTLGQLDLGWAETAPGLFSVTLPGTRKLTTECALEVGRHGVGVRAFVARNPDENHAEVFRWLLQRNLKLTTVAFAVDALGDIYLAGKVPLRAVTSESVDTVLGVVAETSDASFNVILELGFAESIRREWAWRLSRGEPTTNLAAFTHLAPEGSGSTEPG